MKVDSFSGTRRIKCLADSLPLWFTELSSQRNRANQLKYQAVDAPVSHLGWGSSESSIDVGGIFLAFLIHSAALCSASSSCCMVMLLLTWFLARMICSLAIKNHIYAKTKSFGLARRAEYSCASASCAVGKPCSAAF